MEPTLLDVLTEAKALLNKPNGYVKRTLWDCRGGYCALGALYAAEGKIIKHGLYGGWDSDFSAKHVTNAMRVLNKHSPDTDLVRTNNTRDLAAVNEMFCGAIAEVAGEVAKEEKDGNAEAA